MCLHSFAQQNHRTGFIWTILTKICWFMCHISFLTAAHDTPLSVCPFVNYCKTCNFTNFLPNFFISHIHSKLFKNLWNVNNYQVCTVSFKRVKPSTSAIFPCLALSLYFTSPCYIYPVSSELQNELLWSELVFPPEVAGGIYHRLRAVTSHLCPSSLPRQRLNKSLTVWTQDFLPLSLPGVCGLRVEKP
jgi:hypothetical protein